MVANRLSKTHFGLLIFLVLILVSNILLYRTPIFPLTTFGEETPVVVIGSLIDLAIIMPVLVLMITRKKGITGQTFYYIHGPWLEWCQIPYSIHLF